MDSTSSYFHNSTNRYSAREEVTTYDTYRAQFGHFFPMPGGRILPHFLPSPLPAQVVGANPFPKHHSTYCSSVHHLLLVALDFFQEQLEHFVLVDEKVTL